MFAATPILWSLPWVVLPVLSLLRSRNSRSLDDIGADVEPAPPFVSVIVPARNERRNIERCVRSVLSARYPAFEVIVVNDHSTDGTGDVARAIASEDTRLRVVDAPDLPAGWFGKQWACTTGACASRGELLVFTDADTRHEPDLLPRAVNAMRARRADLFSVAGRQEMHGFWERIVQPQIFALLAIRYGGTEHVSTAKRPADVIANGQFILVRRDAYDAVGGHERVRGQVAEDLMLAQEFVRAGKRLVMMLALRQFSTRMYASLGEVIAGWRKNVYAGGRASAIGGAVGRAMYPAMLVSAPIIGLLPPVVLLLAAGGVLSVAWLVWSAIGVAVALLYWATLYRVMELPVGYAALYPLGAAMVLYIAVIAIARGRRVEWKDRQYIASR